MSHPTSSDELGGIIDGGGVDMFNPFIIFGVMVVLGALVVWGIVTLFLPKDDGDGWGL